LRQFISTHKTLTLKRRKPFNILLIEDNPGDVRLTQEAFKEGNMAVDLSVVMDGVEAIKYLRKQAPFENIDTPDLILLDLNLPKKDGREVLKDIKVDPELRLIPVVVLTTSNAESDILNSYKLYANCYINKPVDFDSFFNVIKKIEEFWLSTVMLPSQIR
jgi:chemotaxis family two-component system response regulator Rcp1